jgi:hypothetical protein
MLMAQDPRKQLNDSKLLSSHGWGGAALPPKENWRKILLLWTLLLLSSSLRLVIDHVEEITKGRGVCTSGKC